MLFVTLFNYVNSVFFLTVYAQFVLRAKNASVGFQDSVDTPNKLKRAVLTQTLFFFSPQVN